MGNFEKHTYTVTIKEFRLDSFGHVNNAQYMALFEEARWEMITSRGYGLAQVLEKQISTVVLEATIKFKKEIKNRENIQIQTWIDGVDRLTYRVKQQILRADGALAATGDFVMGCFDLKQRKLIPATPEWLSALGRDE